MNNELYIKIFPLDIVKKHIPQNELFIFNQYIIPDPVSLQYTKEKPEFCSGELLSEAATAPKLTAFDCSVHCWNHIYTFH